MRETVRRMERIDKTQAKIRRGRKRRIMTLKGVGTVKCLRLANWSKSLVLGRRAGIRGSVRRMGMSGRKERKIRSMTSTPAPPTPTLPVKNSAPYSPPPRNSYPGSPPSQPIYSPILDPWRVLLSWRRRSMRRLQQTQKSPRPQHHIMLGLMPWVWIKRPLRHFLLGRRGSIMMLMEGLRSWWREGSRGDNCCSIAVNVWLGK
ncbi:hypothetical protein BCR34DRAFT_555229 [Clohesyomyces aquaticus]|uniref:Uncharacterized protein n=1 Tax=Clohesyomyces aquaticus TaxID=1231657 RepID=A0A1Y2A5M9_9PLEO|nr:hypothetical protein BCR34DRAFT_555229 [Clohesyomyces aquaticus]